MTKTITIKWGQITADDEDLFTKLTGDDIVKYFHEGIAEVEVEIDVKSIKLIPRLF